ncbi:MAG: hypothetical protein ABJC05_05955, partial [Pyrinomonadaceae bacterium]
MPNLTVTLARRVTTPFQRIWIETSAFIDREDWSQVISGLRELIELGPPRPVLVNTLILLGIACFRAGTLKAAGEAWESALAIDPDDQHANLFLGFVLMLSDDFDHAAAAFEKCTMLPSAITTSR